MHKIDFKTNWNNKLDNKVFSTIRPTNPKKYEMNCEYEIFLGDNFKGMAKIIFIKKDVHFSDFTEIQCLLDTGYGKHETQEIIKKMYNTKILYFDYIILKYLDGINKNTPPLLTGGF